jgi:hypothetical protein
MQPQGRKSVRIARQNSDSRALADAAPGETGGEALAHGVKFRVAPHRVAANDRRLVGKAPGAPVQQIPERLAAKRGVHGGVPDN